MKARSRTTAVAGHGEVRDRGASAGRTDPSVHRRRSARRPDAGADAEAIAPSDDHRPLNLSAPCSQPDMTRGRLERSARRVRRVPARRRLRRQTRASLRPRLDPKSPGLDDPVAEQRRTTVTRFPAHRGSRVLRLSWRPSLLNPTRTGACRTGSMPRLQHEQS